MDELMPSQAGTDAAQLREQQIQIDADLCERLLSGDPEAGQEFYNRYHRLARYFGNKAAAQCRGDVVDRDDLSQEVIMHFIEKASQYDATRHTTFSTFASTFVDMKLRRVVDGQYGTHVPGNIATVLRQVHAINESRMKNRQSIMTDEEIAKQFDIPEGPADDNYVTVGAIRQAILLTTYLGSIDHGFSPHADHSPGNEYIFDEMNSVRSVTSEDELSVEDQALRPATQKIVEEILETLTEREANVIRMRFGLFGEDPKTLNEIGQIHGLTREKIRQIESRTMSKLRHYYYNQNAEDYL
jgi:RNA polymerase primary sigma factor